MLYNKWLVKGLLWQVFIRVYKLESGDTVSHVGIFDPALWTVTPLTFSLFYSPPFLWVNKYTVYTYTVCKGGVYGVIGGEGPQTDKYQPQSSFTGQFLDNDI